LQKRHLHHRALYSFHWGRCLDQVVQRLLKNKSDVNARNEDGMNALMLGSQVMRVWELAHDCAWKTGFNIDTNDPFFLSLACELDYFLMAHHCRFFTHLHHHLNICLVIHFPDFFSSSVIASHCFIIMLCFCCCLSVLFLPL